MEDVHVLPYETVPSFYEEYIEHCNQTDVMMRERASIKTFFRVFSKLKDTVRLLKCKGSFNTCEVCNNANDLLRDSGNN